VTPATVATACRVLANEGLVEGILGHVSARVGDDELLVRCRGPRERGLRHTTAADVRRLRLDGGGDPGEWRPPAELPIHTELYRRRPEAGAVVHAHPRSALLCGLAGIELRPVFGAFDIPALRLALRGVPRYERAVLITRAELAAEMLAAMEGSTTCLLVGHGITVAGDTVEQATVRAVALERLCWVSLRLAQLGASPAVVPDADLAELPDLGGHFNDELTWRALVAAEGG
jgi:ribulose-5-phosphate 4-epimerase/fuculose-1-phosphate aldolase